MFDYKDGLFWYANTAYMSGRHAEDHKATTKTRVCVCVCMGTTTCKDAAVLLIKCSARK